MNTTDIDAIDFRKTVIYKIAQFFFLMFWFLKPFYIKDSGSLQLGDICMGISFVFILINMIGYRKVLYAAKDILLLIFLFAIIVINFVYYLKYTDTAFLKPIAYFTFSFMTVYLSRLFLDDKKILKFFSLVLKLNLWIQTFVYIFGAGRRYLDGVRYMGTYNDPNQFAFGVLTTYCLLFCLSRIITVKLRWIYFLLTVFLIYQSASTGMLISIAILFVFEQYFTFEKIKNKGGNVKILYGVYLLVFSLLILVVVGSMFFNLGTLKSDSVIFSRIFAKISQSDSLIRNFIEDRGLTPIFDYPQYMIFGSGEGFYKRFTIVGNELHSTWLGIWFYYGIIPFICLLVWIYKNLNKVDKYIIPVYICIFLEAFTLVNHRQPSFWTLIVLGSIITKVKINEKSNARRKNE